MIPDRCTARARRLLMLAALLVGCADDTGLRLLDLEGPVGQVVSPGPWALVVLTDGVVPQVVARVDEGPELTLPLEALGAGQFGGLLPTAPVGAFVSYRAIAGDETLPLAGPRRVEVIARPIEIVEDPPSDCLLAFRRPLAGQRLTLAEHDSAPQAGLQLTVLLETDLPGGHPVRLLVDDVGYAGVAGGGRVAFGAVTLPPGERILRADTYAPNAGRMCSVEIGVEVE